MGNHAIKTLFRQIADFRSNNQLFACCSFFFHFCCMRKRRRRFEVLAGLWVKSLAIFLFTSCCSLDSSSQRSLAGLAPFTIHCHCGWNSQNFSKNCLASLSRADFMKRDHVFIGSTIGPELKFIHYSKCKKEPLILGFKWQKLSTKTIDATKTNFISCKQASCKVEKILKG